MTLTDLQQVFFSNEWPEFLALHHEGSIITLNIHVSPDIHWLTGHFPDQPVLAGVVQTHWAAELGRHLFALQGEFKRIDNLKFQSVILPGQVLDLRLEYFPEVPSIRFAYRASTAPSDILYSEGKLVF